jgi:hypothetical protein
MQTLQIKRLRQPREEAGCAELFFRTAILDVEKAAE